MNGTTLADGPTKAQRSRCFSSSSTRAYADRSQTAVSIANPRPENKPISNLEAADPKANSAVENKVNR